MTDETLRLAEIKQRLAAATPGPWKVGEPMFACKVHEPPHPGPKGGCRYTFTGWYDGEYWSKYVSRDLGYGPEDESRDHIVAGTWDYEEGGIRHPQDAALIAHAPDDLAWLLARLEQAERERDAAMFTANELERQADEILSPHISALRTRLEQAERERDALRVALTEIADAAHSHFAAEISVGVTEENRRAAYSRLASLAGRHGSGPVEARGASTPRTGE